MLLWETINLHFLSSIEKKRLIDLGIRVAAGACAGGQKRVPGAHLHHCPAISLEAGYFLEPGTGTFSARLEVSKLG